MVLKVPENNHVLPAKALCLLHRCWNANSGDTGGLVDDSWLRIQWPKIDFLTLTPNRVSASNSAAPGGWGLLPWYLL